MHMTTPAETVASVTTPTDAEIPGVEFCSPPADASPGTDKAPRRY